MHKYLRTGLYFRTRWNCSLTSRFSYQDTNFVRLLSLRIPKAVNNHANALHKQKETWFLCSGCGYTVKTIKNHVNSSIDHSKQKEKTTALSIPMWSPTIVLTEPLPAWLQRSDGIWYVLVCMAVADLGKFYFAHIPDTKSSALDSITYS